MSLVNRVEFAVYGGGRGDASQLRKRTRGHSVLRSKVRVSLRNCRHRTRYVSGDTLETTVETARDPRFDLARETTST